MCIQDKRLGMNTSFRFWKTLGTVDIPADSRRVKIRIISSGMDVGTLTVIGQQAPDEVAPVDVIVAETSPENKIAELYLDSDGIVTQLGFTLASVSAIGVFAVETLAAYPLTPERL